LSTIKTLEATEKFTKISYPNYFIESFVKSSEHSIYPNALSVF